MNSLVERIYATKKVEDREGKLREAFPASLQYEDAEGLYDVIRRTKATRTLEVGMAFGVSSLCICQAVQDNGGGNHTSIDPWQEKWFDHIGRLNVERAGFGDMFRLIEEPSGLALAGLLRDEEHFDFIFIDGNHRFEYTLVDFFYAERLLAVGGVVMLHDAWLPAVRKVFSFIEQNRMDCFEMPEEFLGKPAPPPTPLRRLKRFLRRTATGKAVPLRQFGNHFLLRKTAEESEEAFSQKWDFFQPF